MRPLGLRKSLYLLPTAFLIVLVCFLQFHYPVPVESGYRKYLSQKQELIQVLNRATMQDRTVILTMVDESWARPGSILEVLLQSFKSGEGTQRFLNHLVIITMDPKAFEYCRSLHPHCTHPSNFAHYFSSKRQSMTSPNQNVFSWRRNNVLLEVLELGYNIICTDADVLWLRSPLSNFHPRYELSISCNFSSDDEQREGNYQQDGGIFFLKANAIAFDFLKHWKLTRVLYPDPHDEESLCATVMQSQDIADAYGFRLQHVNRTYLGEFCQVDKDMLRKAHTIHANCCDDLNSKVHDLRIVLDDWIRFRKGVSGDNTLDKMALRWPQKCVR